MNTLDFPTGAQQAKDVDEGDAGDAAAGAQTDLLALDAVGASSVQQYSVGDDATDYNDVPTYPDRPHFHEHHLSCKPATQVVAFDGARHDPFRPSAMPLYQTATFLQPDARSFGPYDYTRSGNPTRTALETLVAGLEDAHSAFCFTSGMAALSTVARLVESGKHIICGSDIYGGMHRLLSKVSAKRQGIQVSFVDTSRLDVLKAAVDALPKDSLYMIHMESPSNPLMRISDIQAVAEVAHEAGALLSVDNTMMSPYLCKPLSLGADIVVHSGTKYLSGHSDCMIGVVCVKSAQLAKDISFLQNAEGTALAPFDAWLVLRSIKTLAIRIERSQWNTEHVAAFLARHPAVTRLHYVGPIPNPRTADPVPWANNKWGVGMRNADEDQRQRVNISSSHEAYELHMKQSRGGGSVLSFETGSLVFSQRFVEALRIAKITVSFGSVNTLVELPCSLSHASIPVHERTLPSDLIRLSIGIEDYRDLVHDIERAFICAASVAEDVRNVKAPLNVLRELSFDQIDDNTQ